MVRRPGAAGREFVVPGLHLARSEDTVGCHNFRGSQVGGWVEARDAGQHPTKPWEAPHPKNYPAPNANSTEVDGLQTRASEHLLGAKSGHLDVWSQFLEDFGKPYLQADLFLSARATCLRMVSAWDQTCMPCLLR